MDKKTSARPAPSRQTTYLLIFIIALAALALLASVTLFATRSVWMGGGTSGGDTGGLSDGIIDREGDYPFADGPEVNGEDKIALLPFADDSEVIRQSLYSKNAALVDVSSGEVIASKLSDEKIYPASMTKVMTLIVVAEHLPTEASMQKMLTIKEKNRKEWERTHSSGFGFKTGQTLSVESLLYFLILDSDNLAAMELAEYVAGTQDAFVELMNQKAQAMGLLNTHFTNPTGLHDKDHYSSCRDMASIMNYAMKMSFCKKVLTAEAYTTSCIDTDGTQLTVSAYHDLLVTKFENYGTQKAQPERVTVLAGKSGWTGSDSGYCLLTYAEDANGKAYICVTTKGEDPNKKLGAFVYIEDYLTIYNNYVP